MLVSPAGGAIIGVPATGVIPMIFRAKPVNAVAYRFDYDWDEAVPFLQWLSDVGYLNSVGGQRIPEDSEDYTSADEPYLLTTVMSSDEWPINKNDIDMSNYWYVFYDGLDVLLKFTDTEFKVLFEQVTT